MLKSKFSNVALFLPVTAFTSIGYAKTPAQVDQTLQMFCGALEDEQDEVKKFKFYNESFVDAGFANSLQCEALVGLEKFILSIAESILTIYEQAKGHIFKIKPRLYLTNYFLFKGGASTLISKKIVYSMQHLLEHKKHFLFTFFDLKNMGDKGLFNSMMIFLSQLNYATPIKEGKALNHYEIQFKQTCFVFEFPPILQCNCITKDVFLPFLQDFAVHSSMNINWQYFDIASPRQK
ncbi:hypothetical protein [Acinetobacter haemolyticus]|uniref:hypothetical protein n=1 Tax=Acinetobacter haemolyticus TaxID=29430 RepID=UPI001372DC4B|nr:hypothetical protein [Acinetobacter haemolyticus]NAR59622.1 hypothetical protein [Acinetobacter haemolyticus]NAR65550.1 hypothetical protein [Acinetobacter haemolyticus]NAR81629.1 hypothetical protein [Acinetobacter haemolyticus]NAR92115.1 hypothetical protein [Acinetobacter haemolyticus]